MTRMVVHYNRDMGSSPSKDTQLHASGPWTALNSSPNIINGGQFSAWSLLDCPVILFQISIQQTVTLDKLIKYYT